MIVNAAIDPPTSTIAVLPGVRIYSSMISCLTAALCFFAKASALLRFAGGMNNRLNQCGVFIIGTNNRGSLGLAL